MSVAIRPCIVCAGTAGALSLLVTGHYERAFRRSACLFVSVLATVRSRVRGIFPYDFFLFLFNLNLSALSLINPAAS